jgi:hypothetical protein
MCCSAESQEKSSFRWKPWQVFTFGSLVARATTPEQMQQVFEAFDTAEKDCKVGDYKKVLGEAKRPMCFLVSLTCSLISGNVNES